MIFVAFLRCTKNKIIWTMLEKHNFLLQRLLAVYKRLPLGITITWFITRWKFHNIHVTGIKRTHKRVPYTYYCITSSELYCTVYVDQLYNTQSWNF